MVKTSERWIRGVLQHEGGSGLLTKFTTWEVNAFWLFLRVLFSQTASRNLLLYVRLYYFVKLFLASSTPGSASWKSLHACHALAHY